MLVDISELERAVFTHRVQVADRSVCVEPHYSLRVVLQQVALLKRIIIDRDSYLLVPHVVVLLRDEQLLDAPVVEAYEECLHVCTPAEHVRLTGEGLGPHPLEPPLAAHAVHNERTHSR